MLHTKIMVNACVCRWLVHAQRLHPAMGRRGIVFALVSWALLSTWRMICGTIHAACRNHGQCLCLPMVGACAETASSHGQTRHSTCTCKLSFIIYMVYDRWHHPCCVPGVGQYCACRCLMQKLYSVMGRHLYHLCCIRGVWSMLCLLLVWCPMAFNHQQTWYGNYILYAASYHVLNMWSMFSSVLCEWGMIYGQCCVCWWSDSRLHSKMGRRSMEICNLYPELSHVLGAWPILPSALCLWAMTNAVSALAGFLTAPDYCQIQHEKCVCVLSFTIYMVFNLCLHQWCMHEEWYMLCPLMVRCRTAFSQWRAQHVNLYFVCWTLPCT